MCVALLYHATSYQLLQCTQTSATIPSLLLKVHRFRRRRYARNVSVRRPRGRKRCHRFCFGSSDLQRCKRRVNNGQVHLLKGYATGRLFRRHGSNSRFLLLTLRAPLPIQLCACRKSSEIRRWSGRCRCLRRGRWRFIFHLIKWILFKAKDKWLCTNGRIRQRKACRSCKRSGQRYAAHLCPNYQQRNATAYHVRGTTALRHLCLFPHRTKVRLNVREASCGRCRKRITTRYQCLTAIVCLKDVCSHRRSILRPTRRPKAFFCLCIRRRRLRPTTGDDYVYRVPVQIKVSTTCFHRCRCQLTIYVIPFYRRKSEVGATQCTRERLSLSLPVRYAHDIGSLYCSTREGPVLGCNDRGRCND